MLGLRNKRRVFLNLLGKSLTNTSPPHSSLCSRCERICLCPSLWAQKLAQLGQVRGRDIGSVCQRRTVKHILFILYICSIQAHNACCPKCVGCSHFSLIYFLLCSHTCLLIVQKIYPCSSVAFDNHLRFILSLSLMD